jgi:serine/threonine protein kinase
MEFRIAVRCVLSCISELHKAGFVHRDIRWPNIIKITRKDGSVRFIVIDFEHAALNDQPILTDICRAGSRFVFAHDLKCMAKLMKCYSYAKAVSLGTDGDGLCSLLENCSNNCPPGEAATFLNHPFFQDLGF